MPAPPAPGDRIALAGAVDDLLQCTDTQAACSCGDAFDYASSMAKSCDEVLDDTSPIYRLGKLLATQCDGANTDDDDDAGDSGSDGDKSELIDCSSPPPSPPLASAHPDTVVLLPCSLRLVGAPEPGV